MTVAAIVVNYNTADATLAAVEQLMRDLESVPGSRVVVVDNASPDGSAEVLRRALQRPSHQGRVSLVETGHNGGYGFGINVGVRTAMAVPTPPRFIYVMNPDAAADAGSVATLLRFMDEHPAAGMTGSLIHGPQGEVQAKAFRFLSVWSEFEGTARLGAISRLLRRFIVSMDPASTGEVDWISGTSMLIRSEVFAQGCWFDQGFFLYYEEIDFARRLKNGGWKIYYVADAPITHVGSLSTGMRDLSRRMPGYWFESRRRYFVKHHGQAYAAAADAAWLLGYAVHQCKRVIVPEPNTFRPGMGRDLLRFSLKHLWRAAPVAPQNRHLGEPGLAPGEMSSSGPS